MDIGIELGMILFQNDRSGAWKLKLFVTFLFAYVAGGFLGALCFDPSAISGPDFVAGCRYSSKIFVLLLRCKNHLRHSRERAL